MIELTIKTYLSQRLAEAGIEVGLELPPGKDPAKYVVIEKTGSSKTNRLPNATLAIQSYGPTLYDAASLNESIKTIMEEAVSLDDISKVSINSDYNFSDPDTKRYRYQAIFQIWYYE